MPGDYYTTLHRWWGRTSISNPGEGPVVKSLWSRYDNCWYILTSKKLYRFDGRYFDTIIRSTDGTFAGFDIDFNTSFIYIGGTFTTINGIGGYQNLAVLIDGQWLNLGGGLGGSTTISTVSVGSSITVGHDGYAFCPHYDTPYVLAVGFADTMASETIALMSLASHGTNPVAGTWTLHELEGFGTGPTGVMPVKIGLDMTGFVEGGIGASGRAIAVMGYDSTLNVTRIVVGSLSFSGGLSQIDWVEDIGTSTPTVIEFNGRLNDIHLFEIPYESGGDYTVPDEYRLFCAGDRNSHTDIPANIIGITLSKITGGWSSSNFFDEPLTPLSGGSPETNIRSISIPKFLKYIPDANKDDYILHYNKVMAFGDFTGYAVWSSEKVGFPGTIIATALPTGPGGWAPGDPPAFQNIRMETCDVRQYRVDSLWLADGIWVMGQIHAFGRQTTAGNEQYVAFINSRRCFVTETGDGTGATWATARGQLPLSYASADSLASVGIDFWVARNSALTGYLPGTDTGSRWHLDWGHRLFSGYISGDLELLTPYSDIGPDITALTGHRGGDTYNTSLLLMRDFTAVYDMEFVDGRSSTASWGGVGLILNASPLFSRCRFDDNRGVYGGAFNILTDTTISNYLRLVRPFFKNCMFLNGIADQGVCYWIGGQSRVLNEDCVFVDNTIRVGGDRGGAVYGINCGPSYWERCVFAGNLARNHGGAAFFSSILSSSPFITTFSNCAFYNNETLGSGEGGGIFGRWTDLEIKNCTFRANNADYGGGISVWGAGAIFSVSNTIFWANIGRTGSSQIEQWEGGSALVGYSQIQGGFSGTGNASTDPLLVPFDAGNPYVTMVQIQDGSPCINTGSNSFYYGSRDFLGQTRIIDGVVDKGAYEAGDSLSINIPVAGTEVFPGIDMNITGEASPSVLEVDIYVWKDGEAEQLLAGAVTVSGGVWNWIGDITDGTGFSIGDTVNIRVEDTADPSLFDTTSVNVVEQPNIELDPTSVDYGSVVPGTDSPITTVTIQVSGTVNGLTAAVASSGIQVSTTGVGGWTDTLVFGNNITTDQTFYVKLNTSVIGPYIGTVSVTTGCSIVRTFTVTAVVSVVSLVVTPATVTLSPWDLNTPVPPSYPVGVFSIAHSESVGSPITNVAVLTPDFVEYALPTQPWSHIPGVIRPVLNPGESFNLWIRPRNANVDVAGFYSALAHFAGDGVDTVSRVIEATFVERLFWIDDIDPNPGVITSIGQEIQGTFTLNLDPGARLGSPSTFVVSGASAPQIQSLKVRVQGETDWWFIHEVDEWPLFPAGVDQVNMEFLWVQTPVGFTSENVRFDCFLPRAETFYTDNALWQLNVSYFEGLMHIGKFDEGNHFFDFLRNDGTTMPVSVAVRDSSVLGTHVYDPINGVFVFDPTSTEQRYRMIDAQATPANHSTYTFFGEFTTSNVIGAEPIRFSNNRAFIYCATSMMTTQIEARTGGNYGVADSYSITLNFADEETGAWTNTASQVYRYNKQLHIREITAKTVNDQAVKFTVRATLFSGNDEFAVNGLWIKAGEIIFIGGEMNG